MTTPDRTLFRFSRFLWLTMAMFVVFAATFFLYIRAEKRIDSANALREQSLRLAGELRQSSDDLTRMARTYVVTGDPLYKQHYEEVLAIRDGRMPRPAEYYAVYWDLVLGDDKRPRPMQAARSLLDMMDKAGFSEQEKSLAAQAKANSDALVRTEREAMAIFESPHPPTQADRDKAMGKLYDAAYHRAKAEIMAPIAQFQQAIDRRTLAAVRAAAAHATNVRLALMAFGLLLLWLLWRVRSNLYAILGAPVQELHALIARLGSGDFAASIPVAAGMKNSVLGWLSETQINLARIDAQRHNSEARNQRITQLYAALSQCNQAIVHCSTEGELFAQICRVAVKIGGMKMAWIGAMDPATGRIKAVAAFGSGVEYLTDLHISADADDAHGRGPTGTAYRENRPIWCQDFQRDPSTEPWRERSAEFGWAASASLPLHRDDAVAGVLTLYAEIVDPFDNDVRNLLLEMAGDIDFALKSFAIEMRRRQAENALRESEQRLRTIIETEPECIKVVDGAGRVLQMNAAGLAMLEADSLEQIQRSSLLTFIAPEYRPEFADLQRRVMRGESGILEFEVTGLKGTRRWLETHAAPMRNTSDEATLLLGVTRDITARKQSETRIQYMAHFDALTGLPNRALLEDRANYAISLAQRSHAKVALMLLDLDHFKHINDTLGHSIGDALLVEMAKRLRQTLRDEDTVARVGGDEFIFLLPRIDAHGAALIAQKLLSTVAQPCRIDRYDLNVTGSIGISMYPSDGADMETLFKSADSAMYCAKREGRNGFRYFTAEMQARSARNLQLINALRHALERKELSVCYQPQFSLQDERMVGAEALLRWNHPELGAVSPAEFIPAAEDSGLILPIGEWVLRTAARQAKTWMQQGMAPLIMAVNLSAVQFRHPDLPKLVARILDEEGLPPEYLELELTEGVAMHDPRAAIAVMNSLHQRGVRMSIDDFGTGYSSLSHLKKFKVYKLKIDQSFVRDISTDPEDKAIVGAIVNMAKSLGLQTIAEGVETAGQLAFLREQGCDEVQGYYYSKPLPADRFAQFTEIKRGAG